MPVSEEGGSRVRTDLQMACETQDQQDVNH